MRTLVEQANRVLVLDGCGMACGTRLNEGAFPNLKPEVVFTDRLFEYDPDLFGVDEMPEAEINSNAHKVATRIINEHFSK
jgi:hypothetical protein